MHEKPFTSPKNSNPCLIDSGRPLVLLRTGAHINEVSDIKNHHLIDGHVVVDIALSEGDLKFARKSGEQVFYRVTPELWDMLQTHS